MNMVDTIGYKIRIIFVNGEELTIEQDVNITQPPVNYIVNLQIQEKMFTQNQNPIGVVTSNLLKLELNSLDRSLVPENTNSPYYGNMNSTAEIEVSIKNMDAGVAGYINLGRYFVNSWSGSATSSNKNKVTIEGNDILGILMKSNIPSYEIKRNTSVYSFLNTIADKINEQVSEKYKFSFNIPETLKFGNIDNNDIEASDVGTLFNIVCQSCLLNMYVDRNTETTGRVINVIDATAGIGASIDNITDSQNIIKASFDKGALVGYTGVKVNYSIYSINPIDTIATISSLALIPGGNSVDNIGVSNTIFKITGIRLDTESIENSVEFTGLTYNRKSVSLKLTNNSIENVNCSVDIMGQTLNENKLAVVKKSTVESNELFEVTNSLLPVNSVNSFASELLSLIDKRTEAIVVEGYFDPRVLKLNSIIQIDASNSLYLQGKYRASEITWTLGSGLGCQARFIKQ